MTFAELDPFALAARKYRGYPGEPERVYRALCYVLSDRIGQAEWEAFSPDDWRIIEPMAETEGVAPLLYWKLKRYLENEGSTAHEELSALVKRLAPAYYETLAHNTILLRELGRILAAFEEAGIEVIVLKGAALAQTVYEDIGLRPMSDIDLLVAMPDRREAQSVLERLGYRSTIPELFTGFNHYLGSQVHLTNSVVQKAHVELHWGLFSGQWDRREPSLGWFWQYREPLAMGAQYPGNTYGMSAEAMLLYLSAHTTLKHGGDWNRLIWWHDIYLWLTTQRERISWQTVFQQAVEFHWEQSIAEAVRQVSWRFQLVLPEEVQGRLSEFIEKRTTPLRQNVASERLHTLNTWDALRYLQWPARVRVVFGLIFPNKEYMRWRYQSTPSWGWPLSYLYRWIILARDNWRALSAQRKRL